VVVLVESADFQDGVEFVRIVVTAVHQELAIEKKQQKQLIKLARKFGYQLTPTLDVATS
jgi:hypothetical protein